MNTWRACLIVACIAQAAASAAPAQVSERPGRTGRVDRLEDWLAAVERHQPGDVDTAALEVRQLDRGTLRLIWIDTLTIVSLIREPDIGIFFAPPEPVSASIAPRNRGPQQRPTQVMYSRSELNDLRVLVRRVVNAGGEDRLLKRAATLHADIAMLAPVQGGTPGGYRPPGPQRVTLFVRDGQQAGLDDAASHWEMGRRLLDQVRAEGSREPGASPGQDAAVRAWYLAGASFMQSIGQLDPMHVEKALRLFPRDPSILFFAACLHETLSSPEFQTVMQSVDVPRDLVFDVGSEAAELRDAERLFEQTVEIMPAHNEARIRLGRVLGRRGRHEEAARELRTALASTQNRLLLFYGSLFLGAEAEALGRHDEAQASYERAAALYPRAQSPRIALSALAARRGERGIALEVAEAVMTRDEVNRADDPWWDYHVAQARITSVLVDAMYRLVRSADRP